MRRKRTARLATVIGVATVGLSAAVVGPLAGTAAAQAPVDPAARALVEQYVALSNDTNMTTDQATVWLLANGIGKTHEKALRQWARWTLLRAEMLLGSGRLPADPSQATKNRLVASVGEMACTETTCTAEVPMTLPDSDGTFSTLQIKTTITLEKTIFGWKLADGSVAGVVE